MTGFTKDAYRFSPDAYPRFLLEPGAEKRPCLGTDLNIWFPEPRSGKTEARDICNNRCPLLAACRKWALEQPPDQLHGVWGGMTQYERIQHHRARQEAAA